MKKMSVLTAGAVLLLSAALASADPWDMGGPGPENGLRFGYGMGPYAACELNLTAEQSAKLQTLRAAHLKEIAPLQNQLLSKRAEINLLLAAPEPDPEKIMARQREISRLHGQLSEKAIQFQLDCRSLLTKEQKAKLMQDGAGMVRGNGPVWQRR